MNRRNVVWLTTAALWFVGMAGPADARENLVANPAFEVVGENGFFSGWRGGPYGKIGKTLFAESTGAHAGQRCLRVVGIPNTFSTCAAKPTGTATASSPQRSSGNTCVAE